MSAIKIIQPSLERKQIRQCPRCNSYDLKIIHNHRRLEGWSDKNMIEKGEPPDVSQSLETNVDIKCKRCNCQVQYKE